MLVDGVFHVEIYYGRTVSSRMTISVISGCIAGAVNHLTRYINCNRIRVNSERMFLGSTWPESQVSISHTGNQQVQIFVNTILDRSRIGIQHSIK